MNLMNICLIFKPMGLQQNLSNNHTKEINSPKAWLFPFILITSLFFFWGFVHNIDPILIAHLRKTFQLTIFQSSLVDSAVFIAYFLMAIPAGLIMKKYGYRSGIIIGLLFFACGAFLFVPAANTHTYGFFLGALFIIACGLAILETAANPYAIVLGPTDTAAFRLNLAQSFNGLAAFIAPLVGRWLILTDSDKTDAAISALSGDELRLFIQTETDSVKMPFVILGIVILIIAVVFYFTPLPEIKEEESKTNNSFLHALQYPQLAWAVFAQFFYVGAQVCVGSFFLVFASNAAGLSDKEAAAYTALYGAAFMIGRFAGTFFMKYIEPVKLLAIYSFINILLSLVAIYGKGMITIYSLIGIAFFMSIMFPTIFALGIKGLGSATKPASSLIIMSIVGGALLPPVLGIVSDTTGSIQNGYFIPFLCFIVVLLFALRMRSIKNESMK
jgi:FHS family L-fucose permease-like MFS transporter